MTSYIIILSTVVMNRLDMITLFISARVENNVDYWGADIRNFRSKGVQDCYNNCKKQKGCASFAMRKTDSYCWLKKKRNGAKRTGNRDRLSANMVPGKGC